MKTRTGTRSSPRPPQCGGTVHDPSGGPDYPCGYAAKFCGTCSPAHRDARRATRDAKRAERDRTVALSEAAWLLHFVLAGRNGSDIGTVWTDEFQDRLEAWVDSNPREGAPGT